MLVVLNLEDIAEWHQDFVPKVSLYCSELLLDFLAVL
jgi:hypothetical protein